VMSVCLSVREDISGATRAIFTNFMHVAYGRASVRLREGDEIPREAAILGVSSPLTMHCNAIAGCKRIQPVGREGGDGSAHRRRRAIYDCLVVRIFNAF